MCNCSDWDECVHRFSYPDMFPSGIFDCILGRVGQKEGELAGGVRPCHHFRGEYCSDNVGIAENLAVNRGNAVQLFGCAWGDGYFLCRINLNFSIVLIRAETELVVRGREVQREISGGAHAQDHWGCEVRHDCKGTGVRTASYFEAKYEGAFGLDLLVPCRADRDCVMETTDDGASLGKFAEDVSMNYIRRRASVI